MDLIDMGGVIIVAGPDTIVSVAQRTGESVTGLRFRPGVLPRLLGVPASELRDKRVPLKELRDVGNHRSLADLAAALASERPRNETAPWSLPVLGRVTASLAAGAPVSAVADDICWSDRSLQRQCTAVYGYGPATLRRILRFRRAVRLLNCGLPTQEVAVRSGYADQPHLNREVRAFAGVPPSALRTGQDGSTANRSTEIPSGSSSVA